MEASRGNRRRKTWPDAAPPLGACEPAETPEGGATAGPTAGFPACTASARRLAFAATRWRQLGCGGGRWRRRPGGCKQRGGGEACRWRPGGVLGSRGPLGATLGGMFEHAAPGPGAGPTAVVAVVVRRRRRPGPRVGPAPPTSTPTPTGRARPAFPRALQMAVTYSRSSRLLFRRLLRVFRVACCDRSPNP